MRQQKPAQMQASPRLHGLDLARYLAFVGMVIVNFKIAMGAQDGTGLLTVFTQALEGRAAASFVVLAGVGLGLAGAKRLKATMSVSLKRAAFLLVIGLINMTVFDADILHYYAFYFLFGALLLPLGNRALFGIIIALNLTFVVMIFALDYDAGWNWDDYTYTGFWTRAGFVRNLFFNGWHPVIPWLGFLLYGVIVSRWALGTRRTQLWLLFGGAALFGFAEFLGVLLSPLAQAEPELADLLTTSPIPPMPLYTLAGIGAASAVIGGGLLVSEHLSARGILQIFVPAGRQTLTLYIAHILIGMGLLDAFGMLDGQGGTQTVWQSVAASLVFCLAATLYAYLWAKRFKRGPVEALMRKLAG